MNGGKHMGMFERLDGLKKKHPKEFLDWINENCGYEPEDGEMFWYKD